MSQLPNAVSDRVQSVASSYIKSRYIQEQGHKLKCSGLRKHQASACGRGGRYRRRILARATAMQEAVDKDQPEFHVMPHSGWCNDVNGPIYFQNRYHM